MPSHTPQIDPHLNSFLCDVLVDFGGRVLVEAVKKNLKQSSKAKAAVKGCEPGPGIILHFWPLIA